MNWNLLRRATGLLPAAMLLAVLVAPAAAVETTRNPMQYFFMPGRGNLPEEVALAKAGGQSGILIMFEAGDCPYCEKMKAAVLNQVEVQDFYRKHFRVLAVDVDGRALITDFSGRQTPQRDFAFEYDRARATPVFAFFALDGRLITRYTGATRDAEEFLWLGEFVASGAWKAGDFAGYRRMRAAGRQ